MMSSIALAITNASRGVAAWTSGLHVAIGAIAEKAASVWRRVSLNIMRAPADSHSALV